MLNKKIKKRFIALSACLLLLPNVIHATLKPASLDTWKPASLDIWKPSLADKVLDTAITVVGMAAIGALVGIITKIIMSQQWGFSSRYYEDWTNKSKNSNTLLLTQNQENFLIDLLNNIGSNENPHAVITGDAGSGKTTIVRSFATKIAHKDRILKNTQFNNAVVWSVDTDALNDAGIVGQTPRRLKSVWNEAKKYHKKTGKKVILFFDEFHRLIQTGDNGFSTTQNLGEVLKTLTGNKTDYCGVHIIGATTTDEYKRYIEPKGAMKRRFPKYTVPPINDRDALLLLNKELWHYQKKHRIFIPEKELNAISKECIRKSKLQQHNPNPDQLKKLFEKMIVQFAKTNHLKDLDETKTLYEEIHYLEKRICELTPTQDKKTWVNWLTSCLWSQEKTDPAIINKTITQIKTIFHEKESTVSQRERLRNDLWKYDEDIEKSNLTYTTKNNLRKQLRQALQDVLQKKKRELQNLKYKKIKLKAIIIGHARLTAEKQKLTQQEKTGCLTCTSILTQEKHIDKAIFSLSKLMQEQETKLLNFDDKVELSSVILDYRHACQELQQISPEERFPSQALSMYT